MWRGCRRSEAAHPVRLQALLAPVARDARGADSQFSGHRACAPVRVLQCVAASGLLWGGQPHPSRHIDRARRRTTWQIMLDALQTRFEMALAPTRGLDACNVQRHGSLLVLQARRGQQQMAARKARRTLVSMERIRSSSTSRSLSDSTISGATLTLDLHTSPWWIMGVPGFVHAPSRLHHYTGCRRSNNSRGG